VNCHEFHELAPGYALDALSEAERAACQAHLHGHTTHVGCIEQLSQYRRVLVALPELLPGLLAPRALWLRIEQALPRSGVLLRLPGARARELVAYAVAVAACLALAFILQARGRDQAALGARSHELSNLSARFDETRARHAQCLERLDTFSHELELERAALALAALPGTRVVALSPLAGKQQGATALVAAEGGRVLVLASNVAARPDQDLQLWTLRGGTPEPAGFLHVLARGLAVGEIDRQRLASGLPDAFALSREPLGGSLTPSDILAVGAVKGS
jgi:hypothetical protein